MSSTPVFLCRIVLSINVLNLLMVFGVAQGFFLVEEVLN